MSVLMKEQHADHRYYAQNMQVSDVEPSRDQLRLLHATIKKVTVETEELRFNTAIAAMMEFINGVYKWENRCAHHDIFPTLSASILST